MVVGIIIAVVVVLIVLWPLAPTTGLVTLRNRVKNGWAADRCAAQAACRSYSESVETVKGYAAHESQVFTRSRRPVPAWSRPRKAVTWRSASPRKTS